MLIDTTAATTLLSVVRAGSFEAAAASLHVTPSAVSQRITALERRVGRVVLTRGKPVTATPAGQTLLRLALQWELLEREVSAELGGLGEADRDEDAPLPSLPIVVNADSLATWFVPVLSGVRAKHRVVFDLVREDEDHSTQLLREGRVLAAVTSDPRPVHGCRVVPLGRLRYQAVATPEYLRQWLPDGPVPAGLAKAPIVSFDRKDVMQDRMLRRLARKALSPPASYLPSSRACADAVRHGLGWGLLPEAWAGPELEAGTLAEVAPGRHIDVRLYWQHWALSSPLLDALTAQVRTVAGSSLRPPGRVATRTER